eukprot:CAMPEP_0178426696 /NCGR_PEP_ID=MMETSP0689_2-20121128/29366_1 /TAXON_ID=160604 /ORGANISM="Amphidinium massartii, Strain CS-259" /LENGTH=363 /DNA_ID=CAMNT_0020048387 /DNA_START=134 /DNA_END=1223 /DNA_ORIENTATION=+
MASSSNEPWVWYQVQNCRATRIQIAQAAIVDDLARKIKGENPDLPPARFINIYQSEQQFNDDPAQALNPWEQIGERGQDPMNPLYVHYEAPATSTSAATATDQQQVKKFRLRVLEREGVPFMPRRILPETVKKMVTKDEEDYWRRLGRMHVVEVTRAGTTDPVLYNDIEHEPMGEWNSTNDVKYDAHLDVGDLSSKYAAMGVRGYHDALEVECGEWLQSNRKTMANHGLFHKDHRYQVFLKSPLDKAERERDGLVVMKTFLALVSVKSCFGKKELDELIADIHVPEDAGDTPNIIDMQQWLIKKDCGKLVPLLNVYREYHPESYGTPASKRLRMLAALHSWRLAGQDAPNEGHLSIAEALCAQ